MLTIDLDKLRARFKIDSEAHINSNSALCIAIEGSVRVRLRMMRLTLSEAMRRLEQEALGVACVETRVRIDAHKLYVDTDIEIPLARAESLDRAAVP